MSEQKKSTCNKCNREIKWSKKTLKNGKEINVPMELDGTEHTEKVGDVWQCKKAPQTTPDKGQDNLDKSLTEANLVQALGKIITNLEARKDLEEKILLVLEQIRDKK